MDKGLWSSTHDTIGSQGTMCGCQNIATITNLVNKVFNEYPYVVNYPNHPYIFERIKLDLACRFGRIIFDMFESPNIMTKPCSCDIVKSDSISYEYTWAVSTLESNRTSHQQSPISFEPMVISTRKDSQSTSSFLPLQKENQQRILNLMPTRPSCSQCEHTSGRKTNAQRHEKTHSQNNRIPCRFCYHTFTRPDNLKRHLENKHHYYARI
ncbi:hypothetical protein CLU79DRAFT_340368 [Phycomyces nitens]|nr:hypothetical protein CLU79DRAFT_340368 [Phycomyces nitens]